MNEINATITGNSMYHTEQKISDNETIFTGFCKKEINVGDIFFYHPKFKYEITQILERRNRAGIFINDEDKINSFFKIKTKLLNQK